MGYIVRLGLTKERKLKTKKKAYMKFYGKQSIFPEDSNWRGSNCLG